MQRLNAVAMSVVSYACSVVYNLVPDKNRHACWEKAKKLKYLSKRCQKTSGKNACHLVLNQKQIV